MRAQNLTRAMLALAAGALLLSIPAVAQDMPMPKPGPEHKLFEMDAAPGTRRSRRSCPARRPRRARAPRPTRSAAAAVPDQRLQERDGGRALPRPRHVGLGPRKEEVRGHLDRLHVGRHLRRRVHLRPATKTPPAGWRARHDGQAGQVQGRRPVQGRQHPRVHHVHDRPGRKEVRP